MGFVTFLANNSMLIAIATIIIFLSWQFYFKPKFNSEKKEEVKQPVTSNNSPQDLPLSLPADNTIKESNGKRISKGFSIMMDKIRNSDYVKGIQEEQETAKENDMLPEELLSKEESGTNKKNKEIKEETNDVFSTDFSKMSKVDF